jgi:phasin
VSRAPGVLADRRRFGVDASTGADKTDDTKSEGASMTSPNYQIPTEVRDFAEKSVEQARKAFEGFTGAAQKAITQVETAMPIPGPAKDVGAKAMSYAEANVKAAFDLAQKLVHAKDVQEVMQLQSDYVKSQFEAIQEQTKELGAAFTKVTTNK